MYQEKKILQCHITDRSKNYDIEIHQQLISNPSLLASIIAPLSTCFVIITHESIASLYGNAIQSALSENNLESYLFSFSSGEQHKTRTTKEFLEDQMLEKNLGKNTCVIAIGGGVVTDLAGYLAATYCRGIPFVTIPTSLLGMVDASIGGKTGVNTSKGKNLIGCIYQPKKVLIDVSLLQTLPIKEFRNGVVEMIKHGLIVDESYFDYLETHAESLLQQEPEILEDVIYTSCRIKKEVVEQDENDKGKRNLLNFGHTIGHALEHLTNYSISHGEAVAIGILVEGHISMQLGLLSSQELDRIYRLLKTYSLPLKLPRQISEKSMMDAMMSDKKSLNSRPRFVILKTIGSVYVSDTQYCMTVDDALINKAIQWMNQSFI